MSIVSDHKVTYTSFSSIMTSSMKKRQTTVLNSNDDSNDGDCNIILSNDMRNNDSINMNVNNSMKEHSNSEQENGITITNSQEENIKYTETIKDDEEVENEEDNPYLDNVKQIESLLSSVVLEHEVGKKSYHTYKSDDDDDDDSLSNEILQLSDAEIGLRKELEEAMVGVDENNDTTKRVQLACSKSLVDDLEEEEEENGDSEDDDGDDDEFEGCLTLEEKVGWDDDFEQVRSPSGYIATYESWEDRIKHLEFDVCYPTISLPNTILSNQQQQRCVYENTNILLKCHREYLLPPPHHHLESMFIDVRPCQATSPVVRVAYIQIRPDVRCGSVMDALAHCITSFHGVITKRQGGHFIALTPPLYYKTNDSVYAPLHIEAQLVTRRTNSARCERTLLLQFFPPNKDYEEENDLLSKTIHHMAHGENELYYQEDDSLSDIARVWQYSYGNNSLNNKKMNLPSNTLDADSEEVMRHLVTSPVKLLFQPKNDKTTYYIPSTLEHMTYYITSGWVILTTFIDQLETRYLSYNTILKSPLCTLPSLTTFDALYISHLQIYCHDLMVKSIIKVSEDIESYAREEEFKTNQLMHALFDTFELYDMELPVAPLNLPLRAYPLNFTPSDVSCPPWGDKVKIALEETSSCTLLQKAIPSYTDTEELLHAFSKAELAVKLICAAFSRQDDDEIQATISRKNMHVMDRMSKLQIFKKDCVLCLHHAYGSYPWATKASDEFFSNSITAIHYPLHTNIDAPQVPLLKCPITLISGISIDPEKQNNNIPCPSSCTTICYISIHYILINITTASVLLSMFSKPTCLLFELKYCKIEHMEDTSNSTKVDDHLEHNLGGVVSIISNYKDENFNTVKGAVILSFSPCCGNMTSKLFVEFCGMVKNIGL